MSVNLEKKPMPQSVNLTKSPGGVIEVVLTWTSRTDVDLAVMYELTDGSERRVVQALDRNFGSLDAPPYIALSGDDRSGGREVVTINLAQAGNIRRALVFAFIYQGGSWQKVGDAEVTVKHPVLGRFYFPLNKARAKSCALVDLQADGEGGLNMTRLGEFFSGYHQEIDSHYGWPKINWVAGSK